MDLSTHVALMTTVAFTTVCWLLTAFFGPQTDTKTLVTFYEKIRPFGPGWNKIRALAHVSTEQQTAGENIPLALLGWAAGCAMIWSALFTVGNFLYGRLATGSVLLVVFILSTAVLIRVFNRIWTNDGNLAKGTVS